MRLRFFLPILFIALKGNFGQEVSPPAALTPTPTNPVAPAASASATATPIKASLGRDLTGESLIIFSPQTPAIFLRWQTETIVPSDRLRCVWIAEDVGKISPRGYHIDENTSSGHSAPAFGSISLSRPKKGWPPGKYRAEVYLNADLVASLPFTIEEPRGD